MSEIFALRDHRISRYPMKQLRNYADKRMRGQCLYCGGPPETREHVPPKVLLDRPFPDNLPVVEACYECNNKFSKDEEYLACLLDCVVSGTTHSESVQRPQVGLILTRHPGGDADGGERLVRR